GSGGCADAMNSGDSTCVSAPTAESIPALPVPSVAAVPTPVSAPMPAPPSETPRRFALTHLELSIYRTCALRSADAALLSQQSRRVHDPAVPATTPCPKTLALLPRPSSPAPPTTHDRRARRRDLVAPFTIDTEGHHPCTPP